MPKLFIFVLLCVSLSLEAKANLVFKKEDNSGQILASYSNPAEKQELLQVLLAMSGSDSCQKEVSASSFEISACLPDPVLKVFLKSPKYEGPNCFGSALGLAKMADFFTEALDQELNQVLYSGFCKQIDIKSLQAKDILVIFKGGEYFHAFSYLTPKYGFTKNGNGTDSTYTIEPIEETIALYSSPYLGECIDCKGKENSPGCAYCVSKVSVQAFRCQGTPTVPTALLKIKQNIDLLDLWTSYLLFGNVETNKEELKQLVLPTLELTQSLMKEQKSYWKEKLKLKLARLSRELSTLFYLKGGSMQENTFYTIKAELEK